MTLVTSRPATGPATHSNLDPSSATPTPTPPNIGRTSKPRNVRHTLSSNPILGHPRPASLHRGKSAVKITSQSAAPDDSPVAACDASTPTHSFNTAKSSSPACVIADAEDGHGTPGPTGVFRRTASSLPTPTYDPSSANDASSTTDDWPTALDRQPRHLVGAAVRNLGASVSARRASVISTATSSSESAPLSASGGTRSPFHPADLADFPLLERSFLFSASAPSYLPPLPASARTDQSIILNDYLPQPSPPQQALMHAPSLPNLLLIKPAAPAIIAASRSLTPPSGIALTKPFSLSPLPYTDDDVPLPEPYNAAFPHPITAYASPGVNPHTIRQSGYDRVLASLLVTHPDIIKGDILAACDREGITAPALALHTTEGEGNGIPERLWTKFDSLGAARLPLGSAPGASTFFRPTPTSSALPPRFQALPFDVIKPPTTPTTPGALSDLDARAFGGLYQAQRSNSVPNIEAYVSPRQVSKRHSDISLGLAADLSDSPAQSMHSIGEAPASYKTELCLTWQAGRVCKYFEQCQFAHGYHELRLPSLRPTHDVSSFPSALQSSPFDSASPPVTPSRSTGPALSSAYPLPSTSPSSSYSAGGRQELRRASMPPHSALHTVKEHEDDTPLLGSGSGHTSRMAAVAPIGAERFSPSKSRDSTPTTRNNTDGSRRDVEADFSLPWLSSPSMPPFRLSIDTSPQPMHPSSVAGATSINMTPRLSSSSISTASSSRFSTSSEGSYHTWGPAAEDHTTLKGREYDTACVPDEAYWNASIAAQHKAAVVGGPTDTLDFSIGRSIWSNGLF